VPGIEPPRRAILTSMESVDPALSATVTKRRAQSRRAALGQRVAASARAAPGPGSGIS